MAAIIHLGHIRSPEKLLESKSKIKKPAMHKQAKLPKDKTSEDMAVEKLKFYISRNVKIRSPLHMRKPSSAEEWANEKIQKYQK